MKRTCLFDVEGATDIGLVREKNEDFLAIDKNTGVFVLADGLGGHLGGEIASKLAVNTIINYMRNAFQEKNRNNIPQTIRDAIIEANDAILKLSASDPLLHRMSTTLVVAMVDDADNLHVANIGDSRAYLSRGDDLLLISKDHSAVEELVDFGKITQEEARHHPLRHIVTRVIGTSPAPKCYQKTITLQEKDAILLCSDGLWDMLSDKDIIKIITKEKDLKKLCDDLITTANAVGGSDNITIIAARVKEMEN